MTVKVAVGIGVGVGVAVHVGVAVTVDVAVGVGLVVAAVRVVVGPWVGVSVGVTRSTDTRTLPSAATALRISPALFSNAAEGTWTGYTSATALSAVCIACWFEFFSWRRSRTNKDQPANVVL